MVYFKENEETEEGRVLHYVKKDLKCGVRIDGTQNHLLLIWPTVISHKIVSFIISLCVATEKISKLFAQEVL